MKHAGRSKLLAVALAGGLFAGACAGSDPDNQGLVGAGRSPAEDTEPAQEGGTLVFGAEQEPAILNFALTDGNSFWTQTILDNLLPDAYSVLPDFSYEPQVLDGEAEVTEDPFTVTYKIKEEAAWNDGTPVSADDFVFTWKTNVNPDNDIVDRTGYNLIERAEVVDPKTVTFTFEEPFAAYKDIFDDIVPKHELQGENFNRVWNEEITLSAGPFEFDRWEKGNQLRLVRNEDYWGEHLAYLDEVVFRFITDTNSEIQALRGDEVDAIYPQPQLQLSEVATFEGTQVQATAGTNWEHLDFQYENPLLRKDFVRQAIAHGIDREAIVDQFISQLQPDASVLNNLMFVSNQAEYEDHFGIWDYDPEESERLLQENGCERGSDDIYECDGEKLEFGYVSTAGNELRELQFEAIQQQLADIGIRLKSQFASADIVFGRVLSSQNWDLFNFAWIGSPDPAGNVEIWSCKGGNNFNSYCNEEVTELLAQTNSELDPTARTALFNQADALAAEDLPVLPLYQKPTFLAFHDNVHNMEDNSTNEGPTWNIEEWWIEQ